MCYFTFRFFVVNLSSFSRLRGAKMGNRKIAYSAIFSRSKYALPGCISTILEIWVYTTQISRIEKSATRGFFVSKCVLHGHISTDRNLTYTVRFRSSKSRSARPRFRELTKLPLHEAISKGQALAIFWAKIDEVLRNVVFGTRSVKMAQKQHIGNLQFRGGF